MACGLKFQIVEGLSYLFSANKGADQLQGYNVYRAVVLRYRLPYT